MKTNSIEAAKLNRKKLFNDYPNFIFYLESGSEIIRNVDVYYPFRSNSYFLHLTGLNEADCRLILAFNKSYLFIPKVSQKHKVWLGQALEKDCCKNNYHFNFVHYLEDFEKVSQKIFKRSPIIHTLKPWRHSILNSQKTTKASQIKDASPFLNALRSQKNKFEIKLMKKINSYSSEAHLEVIKNTQPKLMEYQVQNIFESHLKNKGITQMAYPSIVATGVNGSILHYFKNNQSLKKGQMVLIDAGGEFFGYASDITRTFPVNSKYSHKQKDLYQLVLDIQLKCIDKIKPGVILQDLHQHSVDLLTKGLIELGILTGSLEEIKNNKSYFLFYPHGLGHTLGLDVHDVSEPVKKSRRSKSKVPLRNLISLKPGNVITVEPGIYFIDALLNDPKNREKHKNTINWHKIDSTYKNFGGIRIEDDILVNKTSMENLTSAPKTIQEIEELRA